MVKIVCSEGYVESAEAEGVETWNRDCRTVSRLPSHLGKTNENYRLTLTRPFPDFDSS